MFGKVSNITKKQLNILNFISHLCIWLSQSVWLLRGFPSLIDSERSIQKWNRAAEVGAMALMNLGILMYLVLSYFFKEVEPVLAPQMDSLRGYANYRGECKDRSTTFLYAMFLLPATLELLDVKTSGNKVYTLFAVLYGFWAAHMRNKMITHDLHASSAQQVFRGMTVFAVLCASFSSALITIQSELAAASKPTSPGYDASLHVLECLTGGVFTFATCRLVSGVFCEVKSSPFGESPLIATDSTSSYPFTH